MNVVYYSEGGNVSTVYTILLLTYVNKSGYLCFFLKKKTHKDCNINNNSNNTDDGNDNNNRSLI